MRVPLFSFYLFPAFIPPESTGLFYPAVGNRTTHLYPNGQIPLAEEPNPKGCSQNKPAHPQNDRTSFRR